MDSFAFVKIFPSRFQYREFALRTTSLAESSGVVVAYVIGLAIQGVYIKSTFLMEQFWPVQAFERENANQNVFV
jgi:hypothetical protein